MLTKEEEQILTRDSKRAEKLKEKLWDKYNVSEVCVCVCVCVCTPSCVTQRVKPPVHSEGLCTAMEHKDKLLEFDRTR